MVIIEDTRNQKGKHEIKHKRWSESGIEVFRSKLPFGDYAMPPKVAIDTKKELDEIAGNICGYKEEHERFKRECIAAQQAGCKLIILVENTYGIKALEDVHLWINPRQIFSEKAVTGERLENVMRTIERRYGVEFRFCSPDESADQIIQLLEGGNGT